MPSVDIQGPALDIEEKRVLVSEVTQAIKKAYQRFGIADETIVVHIRANKPDDVAVGGVLVADKKK